MRSLKGAGKLVFKILSEDNRFSKWFSLIGFGVGMLLLLCCIQLYIDIDRILNKNDIKKGDYDYISVTKKVTNNNMTNSNSFSSYELDDLKKQKFTSAVAPLISNQFRVKANAGTIVPFSTDLFLESISAKFLDTLPPSFIWKEGDLTIPIIFSADFLEMYNVFAPAQGLPQLSEKTISSVNVILECSGNGKKETFRGNIVALTDRINSILVPQAFMSWANNYFGTEKNITPERIYLKSKNINDPMIIDYMNRNNYRINKDKSKLGNAKSILDGILTGIGLLGVFVILLALLLFSFYLKLMISKNNKELGLLIMLGYSPRWISKQVARKWIPSYLMIISTCLMIVAIINYLFIDFIVKVDTISLWPHISVFLAALLLAVLSICINFILVRKNLIKIADAG